jgi:hypothetical protein
MTGEAEEKGIVSKEQITEQTGHTCSVCGQSDHRVCGCEAKAAQAKVGERSEATIQDIVDGDVMPPAAQTESSDKVDQAMEQIAEIYQVIAKILCARNKEPIAIQDIVKQLKAISETLARNKPRKFPESLN